MLKLKTTLSIIFLMSLGVFAQQVTPAILQISVVDKNSNPVSNYDVLLRPNDKVDSSEILVKTNVNGYWSDTVLLTEINPGSFNWRYSFYTMDSTSSGIKPKWTTQYKVVRPAYTVMDTVKLEIENPVRGASNCGFYKVELDSVPNDSMYARFSADLNKIQTGITWVFGDGDTSYRPYTTHRYDTAGTYYVCHYTDSCGPVCDFVTVPFKVPTCVIEPRVLKYTANLSGAAVNIQNTYPSHLLDSAEWTFSGGIPASNTRGSYNYFFPSGDYEYCLKVNQCPLFCDSIHVNTDCQAMFEVLSASTASNILVNNTSSPKASDSLLVKYMWYFGDGDSASAPFPRHTYSTAGTYNLCLRVEVLSNVTFPSKMCVTEYCQSITGGFPGTGVGFSLNVKDPTVGVAEHNLTSLFTLFPNPVQNILTISCDDQQEEIRKVQVFDLSGNKLFELYNESGLHKEEAKLDLTHLKNGVYIITIHSGNGVSSTHKLVKN